MSRIFMACSRRQPSLYRGGLIHRSGRPCAGHPRTFFLGKKIPMSGGRVYIMTQTDQNGTPYVGVTDDLARAWEHSRPTRKLHQTIRIAAARLCRTYEDMRLARQRERNLKRWRRSWKVGLILAQRSATNDKLFIIHNATAQPSRRGSEAVDMARFDRPSRARLRIYTD